MKIGIIVQARMGSTRLPGKIMRPFYNNKPLIEILLDSLHKVACDKVIVATSEKEENDIFVKYLKERGELVFRGAENDVLKRFIDAAEMFGVEGIVRVCSDNPFLDWHGIAALVDKSKKSDADYIGFRINNMPSIKTHFGFWGEYATLNALKNVQKTTIHQSPAHEHVTIHLYSHPQEYKCEWIECPAFLQGRNDIRLTIDTLDDFVNAQKVYSAVMKHNCDFGLEDIVKYLDANSEILNSMNLNINNNQK